MPLEDYTREINGCFKCSECKIGIRSQMSICPSGEKYGFNSHYSLGRLDIAKALLDGNIEWKDHSLQDPISTCLGCGACHEACYPQMGIPTREIYRLLKGERVSRGYGPPSVFDDVLKALQETDNYFGGDSKKRTAWAEGIKVKKYDVDTDVLFYVGCYGAFDDATMFIARSTANVLNKTGVNWGVLEDEEFCCGYPALDVGCEDEFKRLAKKSIEKMNDAGIKTLIVSCACCFGTMKEDWAKVMPFDFEIVHSSQYLLKALEEGKLRFKGRIDETMTFHDPCHLGRLGGGVYEEPRELLKAIPGVDVKEMARNRDESWCCGAGGGANVCFPDLALETATDRLDEASETGAEAMVIPSCPICYNNFSTVPAGKRKIEFVDLIQLIDDVT